MEILAEPVGKPARKSFQTDGYLLAKAFSREEVIGCFCWQI